MSEQPSKEALEWVKGIAGWASESPSGETTEEAERQFARRVDAFAAAAVARREAEIVARLEECRKSAIFAHEEILRRARHGKAKWEEVEAMGMVTAAWDGAVSLAKHDAKEANDV